MGFITRAIVNHYQTLRFRFLLYVMRAYLNHYQTPGVAGAAKKLFMCARFWQSLSACFAFATTHTYSSFLNSFFFSPYQVALRVQQRNCLCALPSSPSTSSCFCRPFLHSLSFTTETKATKDTAVAVAVAVEVAAVPVRLQLR
jgi:hypothetical protein